MLIEASEIAYSSPEDMRTAYLERRKRLNAGVPKVAKPVVVEPIQSVAVLEIPKPQLSYSDEMVKIVARLISHGFTADEIAAQIGASVEVVQAAAQAMLEKTEQAHSVLAAFMGPLEKKYSLEDIMRFTCEKFNVTKRELKEQRRYSYHVLARQFFFYKCKQLTTKSYTEIARFCGDRDHTTVLHGVRKIERYVREGVLNDEGDVLKIPSNMKASLTKLSNVEHVLHCPESLRKIFADLKSKGAV